MTHIIESDCSAITKVHNKFKNNNKNGNFIFFVNDQLVVLSVPSNLSLAQNLLQLVFQQICETRNLRVFFFFNSALFLLLVGSGRKRSMSIEKLGSSSLVSSIF